MHIQNLEALTHVLQASISPVALMSGVGLLILSQTNRISTVTDRLRRLAPATHNEKASCTPRVQFQLGILLQRARVLQHSITAAVLCVLFASLMVLLIFALAVFDIASEYEVLLLFGLSMVSLIVSLCLFMWDMRLSLKAVEELLKD